MGVLSNDAPGLGCEDDGGMPAGHGRLLWMIHNILSPNVANHLHMLIKGQTFTLALAFVGAPDRQTHSVLWLKDNTAIMDRLVHNLSD
jgi:hypothetical protein